MKTIAKLIIALCILSLNLSTTLAQEYKHEIKNAKKVEISKLTGKIKIVGHAGNSIIITTDELEAIPERAKGLKPISGGGVDNTGIGLNITETENVISISGSSRRSAEAFYTFKIPNALALELDYYSPFSSDDVFVGNFAGEFEMKGLDAGAILTDVTGPVFIDFISGDIEIVFDKVSQKSPMSLKTISGEVDVTLPVDSKVSFALKTLEGDIYTDLDIAIDKAKKDDDDRGYGLDFMGGSSQLNGTMNGGGVKMSISSIDGNLYLRKK